MSHIKSARKRHRVEIRKTTAAEEEPVSVTSRCAQTNSSISTGVCRWSLVKRLTKHIHTLSEKSEWIKQMFEEWRESVCDLFDPFVPVWYGDISGPGDDSQVFKGGRWRRRPEQEQGLHHPCVTALLWVKKWWNRSRNGLELLLHYVKQLSDVLLSVKRQVTCLIWAFQMRLKSKSCDELIVTKQDLILQHLW